MAIDWSNEDYTRLYKRETDDDLLLTWEALAVWHMFLKKCDKGGVLETRRGVRGLAALLRIPLEVVERILPELLEDGRLRLLPERGFVAPNYVAANYVARSEKARKAHSRLLKRLGGRPSEHHEADHQEISPDHQEISTGIHAGTHAGSSDSPNDGDCDGSGEDGSGGDGGADGDRADDRATVENQIRESRRVTHSHAESQISHPNTIQHNTTHSARSRGRRAVIPPDWQPREQERALALELGLDPDSEAREFLTYWQGDGRAKADWDQTFASRLQSQAKRSRSPARDQEVRNVEEL